MRFGFSKKPRVLIFGSSGFGKVVLETLIATKQFVILGFVDGSDQSEGIRCYKSLGSDEDIARIAHETKATSAVIAVGDNHKRSLIETRIRSLAPSLNFPVVIHPTACISDDVVIGEGTIVLPRIVIGPDCKFGRFCLINTAASIGHDSQFADYSSVAPGVTVGGKVAVGEFSAICLGANIIHGVTIGPQTVVGAGAVVVRDQKENVVTFGIPSTVKRQRKPGDPYL